METKTRFMAIAMLAASVATHQIQAQNPTNSAQPGAPTVLNALNGPDVPPPGGRPGKPGSPRPDGEQGPGRREPRGLTSLVTISGTVGQWLGNDDAILDGFTLNGSSGTPTTVKFPPTLASKSRKRSSRAVV
ncbi:hypothetical protein [Spirosoma sp. KNUC1025]|uniref:hypothetical protein n=1 Tax=Spirosoma sp. KNUC1025 TaxID=2894082 RepID=UPI003869955E|nr:hypothetical protein LN737_22910 [Spirosoma sp. KNUC1025]